MAQNQTEIRKRSRTMRATALVEKFRVVTQGADSTDYFRTCIQSAAPTDVPAGISRNQILAPVVGPPAVTYEGSIGQDGEFPVEVAAAVAINDILIVDSAGGIGRVKPVGAQLPPYWKLGIARSVQATIGGVCQIEYAPEYVPAAVGSAFAEDGHRQIVGPFAQDNVAANQAAVALSLGTPAKTQIGHTMTRAGSLVGISVLSNVAAAGDVATFIVTKNGVATALTVTLDAAINGGLKNFAVAAKDAIAFAAGDVIGVTITTPAGWTAVTADVNAEVQFED